MNHHSQTRQPEVTPSIYVACLAAYNNAKLHGTWIDATQDLDTIWDEVNAMLKASPEPNAEEWAIHDHEGFEGIRMSEWTGLEEVHQLAAFVEAHGRLGAMVLDYYGNDIDEALTALEERYHGQYRSLADFAQELTEETTTIPENLAYYIDYERMGRDLEMSGDIFTIETRLEEVHIFWAR